MAAATNQHAYQSEARRLEAEVALARGDSDAAEVLYRESLAIARHQGARWFELRAARGYANLLVCIGRHRHDEAREVLRICDSLTEGRETLDYVYAEALLRTL